MENVAHQQRVAWGTIRADSTAGRTRAGGAAMQELNMLYYALVFLIVGVIAGALGAAGVASVASQIAWVLFVIGIVLLLVHLITGRSTVV